MNLYNGNNAIIYILDYIALKTPMTRIMRDCGYYEKITIQYIIY